MASILMVLGSTVIFIIAYVIYGSWLSKQWGIDNSKTTPSHFMEDGVDYVPASSPILLGHHFASIAGAGPILGPIQAAVFGWVPVLLWIVVGGIFFGGVHDYGSIFASIRNDGKSIGEIINQTMGKKGKGLFSMFAWLTLLLVIAAFSNIVAKSFEINGSAGTSSLLFIIVAITFGFAVYRKGMNIVLATIIGVIALFASIWIGLKFPLQLSSNVWLGIMLVYIFVASVTPVWILLQPRDYLNSYLLYAMMAGAFLGIMLYRPELQLPAYTGFINKDLGPLFPILFVTVACGAISGFHSLVGSGTTSKQVDKESDAKFVGYGGMLIECVLAVIALITAAYITPAAAAELGTPIGIFSNGVATFMQKLGIPIDVGNSFITLSISAFALTSLDTSTRLARFIFQEFFENKEKAKESQHILSNMYVATIITVILGGVLAIAGYAKIWPVFGSANQLLAAIALMAVALWLKKEGKNFKMIIVPMIFMFAVTLSALVILFIRNLQAVNYILIVFPVLLFILAIILIVQSIKLFGAKNKTI